MEEEKLIEAIENIRRDKKDPWQYILFTFLNGIAQGLGVALGMTVVLGVLIWVVSVVLSKMIDFPVIGYYLGELGKLIDASVKAAPKVR